MKFTTNKVSIKEEEVEVPVEESIYLIVVRYTNQDGSQFIRSIPTFNYLGNVPQLSGTKDAEVIHIAEYEITQRLIMPWDCYGPGYVQSIE